MGHLAELFENNRRWAERQIAERPDFFTSLAAQQRPRFLWIGCSDSRVPANQIVGLAPGEVFVHRNVANVVAHADLNCLSVIQYAVDVLGVRDIIVCGHYGCGGVQAALGDAQLGLIDNWIRFVRDVAHRHDVELEALTDPVKRATRLCELNVLAQTENVVRTTFVQNAWRAGRDVTVHGWIYDVADGRLRDLSTMTSREHVAGAYRL
ncbi:MAG: carbonate dehydratase [Gemmatimonadales bacterium]